MIKLRSNVSDVSSKVFQLSFEVSECKPLGGGGVSARDRWTFGGLRSPLRVEPVAVDGAALVDWLTANAPETAPDRAVAVALGQRLMEARLLTSVTASQPFCDSPTALFRLADHAAAPVGAYTRSCSI